MDLELNKMRALLLEVVKGLYEAQHEGPARFFVSVIEKIDSYLIEKDTSKLQEIILDIAPTMRLMDFTPHLSGSTQKAWEDAIDLAIQMKKEPNIT